MSLRSAEDIEHLLLLRLSAIRRRQTALPDATRPFNEFGVDSIEAAGIAVDLESELGISIDPAELMEQPTPRKLARHLAARLAERT
jgi:acyl carrier protein